MQDKSFPLQHTLYTYNFALSAFTRSFSSSNFFSTPACQSSSKALNTGEREREREIIYVHHNQKAEYGRLIDKRVLIAHCRAANIGQWMQNMVVTQANDHILVLIHNTPEYIASRHLVCHISTWAYMRFRDPWISDMVCMTYEPHPSFMASFMASFIGISALWMQLCTWNTQYVGHICLWALLSHFTCIVG